MNFKGKIVGLIGLIIFTALVYFINEAKKEREKNIAENRYQTVGKIYKIESRRSFTHAYYIYYYNGKKYESWTNTNLSENDILNKFYRIELSSQIPMYSKVLFENEVTDKTEVSAAGF